MEVRGVSTGAELTQQKTGLVTERGHYVARACRIIETDGHVDLYGRFDSRNDFAFFLGNGCGPLLGHDSREHPSGRIETFRQFHGCFGKRGKGFSLLRKRRKGRIARIGKRGKTQNDALGLLFHTKAG